MRIAATRQLCTGFMGAPRTRTGLRRERAAAVVATVLPMGSTIELRRVPREDLHRGDATRTMKPVQSCSTMRAP